MNLMLAMFVLFILVGLFARPLRRRHHALIAVGATLMVTVYYFSERAM